jgi:hypothetical protein
VLLVVLPLAVVLCSRDIRVDASAVALVVLPLTLIDVTISVVKCSVAARLVVLPLAFVLGVIRPLHRALTVTQPTLPLTFVNGTSFISMDSVHDSVRIVEDAFESLTRFVVFEVLANLFHFNLLRPVLLSLQKPSDQGLKFDDAI